MKAANPGRRKSKRAAAASWTRMNEILVVLPDGGLDGVSRKALSRLFHGLSREWRVFWVRAPRRGELIPSGQTGLDPVSVDSLPAIKRILSQQVVSAVFLVGESTVASCLESLHAFASHIPYVAVLDEPWSSAKSGESQDSERLEFMFGLADRVLLTGEELKAGIEPFLRRLSAPVDVVPEGASASAFEDFVVRTSGAIKETFRKTQADNNDPSPAAVVGVLANEELAHLEGRVQEWRRSLPQACDRTLLYSARIPAAARRRLERQWPGSRWLRYRDEEHMIELVNRALRSGSSEFSLVVSDRARLNPLCAERLLACGRKLPLVGAVGCGAPSSPPPEPWADWTAFGSAWAMRFAGSYRLAPYLDDDCVLLRRRAVDAVGQLDGRLGWTLAVRDYCLRLRQAGFKLFLAEDAVVHSAPRSSRNGEQSGFDRTFVRKWNLDPLELTKK